MNYFELFCDSFGTNLLPSTAEIPLENVEQFVHTKMGIAKLKTNVFSSGLFPKLIESNREGVKVTVVLDYWEL